MKIALHQITSMKASFEDDMKGYRDAGWSSFELFLNKANNYINDKGRGTFIKTVKESGLNPIMCSDHFIVSFGTKEKIEANEKEFAEKMNLLEALGCPAIIFGADSPIPLEGQKNDNSEKGLKLRDELYRKNLSIFAEQTAKLGRIAKKSGVTLALELNYCGMCKSISTAGEFVKLVNLDNVGLLFDFAHFAHTYSRLSDLDALNGKIVAAHLNDLRDAPPEIRDVNMDRVIPGDGILPLNEWMKKIESLGFKTPYSVEIFCQDLWQKDSFTIAKEVLTKCKKLWPDAGF